MSAAVATPRASTEVAVVRQQLEGMEAQFAAALPAHIPVERFKRVVMTAIQNSSDLIGVSRKSLWNAAMKAAQDGLLPDGREGAIVKFGGEAQWMPMIGGLRKKVRNSGEIVTWDAHVVYANDEFEYELGDTPFIKHKPKLDGAPGEVIAAYSVATLKSGEKSREVMTRPQIDKVRNVSRSKNNGPWVQWFDEMCRKTVARRHSKVLPMSTDLDDLMRRDEALYDFKGAHEEGRGEVPRPKLLQAFDHIAAGPKPASETGPAEAGSEAADEPASETSIEETGGETDEPEDTPRDLLLARLREIALDSPRKLNLAIGKLTVEEQALINDEDIAALKRAAAAAEKPAEQEG